MTYSELKTNIAAYLHRTDLTSLVPNFISLAEAYMFRELQIKQLQVIATGTTTGEYATLPTDFGTLSRIAVSVSGREYSLDYKAQPESPTKSVPDSFALENDKLRIWGASTGQAYTLYYIPDVQPLSDSVTTNWLLDNASDLYLYASALEGAKHVRNEGEIAKLSGQIPSLLASVKNFADRRAQPVTGSMQIKPRR